jgi:gamma-glutamyltranspeptidase/glutathione hydrolase
MLLSLCLAAVPALSLATCLPPQQGAVASSQTDATAVGAAILEQGGNAIDAAIAVHFALAVTYPYAGNLGGGGFFLVHDADGQDWFLDFRETAPAAATPDLYLREDGSLDAQSAQRGWKAVGVPGAVPGMWMAHQKWGKLPWRQLVMPAYSLAKQGFRLDAHEVRRLRIVQGILAEDPLAKAIFLDAEGQVWPIGTLLRQPQLAETLLRIAEEGESPLREGDLVEELVAASREGGGILAAEDFREYQAQLRPVMRLPWRGRTILAASPPSSGGVFLGQALSSLQGFPLALWGWDHPRSVQVLGEATARAFHDRNRWLGDPASMEITVDSLLDPSYLASRRRGMSSQVYTPPSRLGETPAPPHESAQTTHFSVTDEYGAAVSCTTTLNGLFGAKVMAPGGFFLNNEMDDFAAQPGEANQYGLVQSSANAVIAGRRPLSSMCPVIVLDAEGKVEAVIGSPGGPTILTTVLQVLLNRFVYGMSPERAVSAPRFHRQDLPPYVQFEPNRLSSALRSQLGLWGQPIKRRDVIGDVNAIFRMRNGDMKAVADPRSHGAAVVLDRAVNKVLAD